MRKHTWQKLVGIFEIIIGTMLGLPGTFFFIIYFVLQANYTQINPVGDELLTKMAILQMTVMVGLVIVVNGIWKIRDKKD